MKHSLGILLILVSFFLISQIVGLLVIQSYIDFESSNQKGEIVWKSLPQLGGVPFERPDVAPNAVPIYLLAGILLGTLLVWFFARIQSVLLWKIWFFLAVFMCLFISFYSFMNQTVAVSLAFLLSALKVFRPSVIMHNLSEIFLYGGLGAIFVPMLSIFSVFVLIILISLYDAYAVWKSKHMIVLAKFQMQSKLFAGLLIPYKLPSLKKIPQGMPVSHKKIKTALLGGGDVAFPLLFAGTVMKFVGLWQSLIISVCASVALFLLIYFGKKDKFYPAMPFIGAGCFVGYGIILLINVL